MTPQEAQLLQDLVRKVQGTPVTEKDPDAQALLNDGLARDPDALYKLAQTVLIQNIALDQARMQMQRMQQQLAPPQPPGRAASFLGGPQPGQQPPYVSPPPQYQATPPYYPPQPGYAYQPPSGGGGFLRSAVGTAAGVAGGMLAFEGIESLIHHDMGGFGGGFGEAPQETIINNYYDESPPQANGGFAGDPNDPNQQGGDPNYIPGPDEQPQGPYDASGDIGGPDEQPQGPYYDPNAGDAQGFLDDSGGGDFSDGGGDFGSDSGS